jgi:hypothetical protein
MKYINNRDKNMLTRFGNIKIYQPYYKCEHCKTHGYNQIISTRPFYKSLSPKFTELICYEAKDIPFIPSSKKMYKYFGVNISKETIRKASEKIGYEEFQKSKNIISPQEYLKAEELPISNRVYVEIDGSMLNTTEEGWKEYKLIMYFDESGIKNAGENRQTLKKKEFVGSLGEGVENLKNQLKKSMIESGKFSAYEIILISDGAVWIENIFQELFPNALMILDLYHAKEHIWDCAKEIFKESDKIESWANYYCTLIEYGDVDYLLKNLENKIKKTKNQTPLRNLYSYFNTRKKRIQYSKFKEDGYILGSGAIESAHRYVLQNRLKRSGMKWLSQNINAMAQLNNIYFSDNWEKLWEIKKYEKKVA